MGREDPQFLVVGHINKSHGTRGELFVWPLTDHPESVYAPGVVLRLGNADSDEPDPDLPPLCIEAVRLHRKGYLVHFGGFEDRNQSDLVRGQYLFRETEALEPLADGEVFYHQLLGMKVETTDGTHVGEITEVYELSPAHMLEVRGPDREILVPFLKNVIIEVDKEARRIVIDPPAGLLDL
jgi:16S rRNA processing protein RimM